MIIEKAFNAGRNIRTAILKKKGDVKTTVHQLQQVKNHKYDLTHEYLKLCLDYNVVNENSFMVEVLAEDVSSEEVAMSLCLGLMSEETADSDWITLQEAAQLWGKSDSTLRRVIKGPNFVEGNDYKKEGRDWMIRKSSMTRVYGMHNRCK